MFRTALRSVPRRPPRTVSPQQYSRFLSTAPPHQQTRSWRSSAVRWGIAIAGVYYYNTSTLFAEEPLALRPRDGLDDTNLPTLESLSPSSRRRLAEQENESRLSPNVASGQILVDEDLSSPDALEEEAHSEGAFNEETGEINWDCPCLGGMAHGPCGPEFREAFSCFVFSKEEPKGMDCIDRFKHMQDCFRQHPDVYGAELEDDEEDEGFDEDLAISKDHHVADETPHVAVSQPEDTPGVVRVVEEVTKAKNGGSALDTSASPKEKRDATQHLHSESASTSRNQTVTGSANEPSAPSKSKETTQSSKRQAGEEVSEANSSTRTGHRTMSTEPDGALPRAVHDATEPPKPSNAGK